MFPVYTGRRKQTKHTSVLFFQWFGYGKCTSFDYSPLCKNPRQYIGSKTNYP